MWSLKPGPPGLSSWCEIHGRSCREKHREPSVCQKYRHPRLPEKPPDRSPCQTAIVLHHRTADRARPHNFPRGVRPGRSRRIQQHRTTLNQPRDWEVVRKPDVSPNVKAPENHPAPRTLRLPPVIPLRTRNTLLRLCSDSHARPPCNNEWWANLHRGRSRTMSPAEKHRPSPPPSGPGSPLHLCRLHRPE